VTSTDLRLFTVDAATEEQRKSEVANHNATADAYSRSVTVHDAVNIANFARAYMGVSPEAAAAVAQAQLDWDLPQLRSLVLKDAQQQEGIWSRFWNGVQAVTRPTVAVADSIWDMGLGHLTRQGILMYQGEDPLSAYRKAGSSYIGQAVRDISLGRPVRLGEGFLPGPTPINEYPGFGQQFLANLEQSDPNQYGDLQQAYADTYEQFFNEYGPSTVQRAWDSPQATIITATRTGQQYKTPFSFGRAAAVRVSTPGTIPFNMLSGSTDALLRIGWDPLNVPAWKLNSYIKSRKLWQPVEAGEELIEVPTSAAQPAARGPRPAPPTGPPPGQTAMPRAVPTGTTWNLADDVDELRQTLDDLDDLHDNVWGPPTDDEIAALESGIPYIGISEEAVEPRLAALEVKRQHLVNKLGTAGIYFIDGSPTYNDLENLAEAVRGVSVVEFTDVPARGRYARGGDIGPGVDGFVFHGGPAYDPERTFIGGVSTRADRASAGWRRGTEAKAHPRPEA
jgi:hypothetical protein